MKDSKKYYEENTNCYQKSMNSECDCDSKKHHCWERRGIIEVINYYIVWQCTQCHLCIREKIVFSQD